LFFNERILKNKGIIPDNINVIPMYIPRINNQQSNGCAIAVDINNKENEAMHLCKLVCDS